MNKTIGYLSGEVKKAVLKIPPSQFKSVNEIRLRCGRPLAVTTFNGCFFVTHNGGFSEKSSLGVEVSPDDIEYTFNSLCDFSVYSAMNRLCSGFITIQGGHRAGICGSAVITDGKITSIKNISGINLRIAGQAKGCSDYLCRRIFNNSPKSLLVVGRTAGGKTTILRDICRNLGEKFKIAVVDERSEIGAVCNSTPLNSIGSMTDILDGYSKSVGIETALRVLNPDIIVCDEIGGTDDVKAIIGSLNTGVKIIASAHAGSVKEVINRENLKPLFEKNVFDYIAEVEKGEICEVASAEIYRRNYSDNGIISDGNLPMRKAL